MDDIKVFVYQHCSQQTFIALRHHIDTYNSTVLNSLWVQNYVLSSSRTPTVTSPWEEVTNTQSTVCSFG